MTWIFSKDKYADLKDQHTEFHFGEHDVLVNCKDANFQKMAFSAKKGNLFRTLLEGGKPVGAEIMSQANALAANIYDAIGRSMTVDQVKEKLGMEVSSPTISGNDVGDLDDALEDCLDEL